MRLQSIQFKVQHHVCTSTRTSVYLSVLLTLHLEQKVLKNYFFRFFRHIHASRCYFYHLFRNRLLTFSLPISAAILAILLFVFSVIQLLTLLLTSFYCLSQTFYSLLHNCLIPFTILPATCLPMCCNVPMLTKTICLLNH